MLQLRRSGRSFLTLEPISGFRFDFDISWYFHVVLTASPTDYFERANQIIVHNHHRTIIHELSAIVGSRKYCHQLSLRKELITVLDNLMSSTDQVKLIFAIKLGYDIAAECVRHTPLVFFPAIRVFIWI